MLSLTVPLLLDSPKVKGMKMSWESICSRVCVRDILASTDITETTFSKQNLDDILCYAVTSMTSKLLRIYAFNRPVVQGSSGK